MTTIYPDPFLLFMMGLLIAISLWMKAVLPRWNLPPLAGYIVLGSLFRLGIDTFEIFPAVSSAALKFLSDIGIVVLLFRIGFSSHIKALIEQLSRASLLLISDIVFTALIGFLVSYSLLDLALIPSLFVAIALTATSIGVTVSIWKEKNIMKSREGNLLLDLAALDDLATILLIGSLFTLAPQLHADIDGVHLLTFLNPLFTILWKFSLFFFLCYLFSHFLEKKVTRFLRRSEVQPDPMVTIVGIGFIIAAVAAFFDLSLALGALFAGMAFSRDPEALKMGSSLKPLEDLFIPFFFIEIGYNILMPNSMQFLWPTVLILVTTVLAKVLAVALPAALLKIRAASAIILGVSMIPRAEVTMIAMDHGLRLGDWAVTPTLYTTVVLVCLATSILTPLILAPLIQQRKS